MDLILSLKLIRDNAMRIGIGIKFHSLGAVCEYDLSNKEKRDLGTANAPSTDDQSVRFWASNSIYWGIKLFIALHVNTALLYFNRFTISSQLNSLNISADGVTKTACNIIRAARIWSLDILSRFDEEVVPNITDP